MFARRRAQLVPIGIPTICWKTFPEKKTRNQNLKHLDDVIFRVLVFGVKVFLYNLVQIIPSAMHSE